MNIEIKGLDRVMKNLSALPKEYVHAAEAGLFEAGNVIIGNALPRVPVDEGILRDSNYVVTDSLRQAGPTASPGSDALARVKATESEVTAVIGFGGPSAPYALVQHERTDFHHTVGEAKYLEKAVQANAHQVPVIVGRHMERAARGTA